MERLAVETLDRPTPEAALEGGGARPSQTKRWQRQGPEAARVSAVTRQLSRTEHPSDRVARATGKMHSLQLVRVPLEECDWETMDSFGDRVVFQTEPWLRFIAQTQGAEPVVAAVRDGNRTVGWFTGLIIRRFGVRILGSPFAGWSTQYLGFNLLP